MSTELVLKIIAVMTLLCCIHVMFGDRTVNQVRYLIMRCYQKQTTQTNDAFDKMILTKYTGTYLVSLLLSSFVTLSLGYRWTCITIGVGALLFIFITGRNYLVEFMKEFNVIHNKLVGSKSNAFTEQPKLLAVFCGKLKAAGDVITVMSVIAIILETYFIMN